MALDLDRLNPEQRLAAEHIEGPLLVLAGAGSGKTSVIASRIGNLIINAGVAPENILGTTFTNKAASEMRERVRHMIGASRAKGLTLSTFHALCVRILRADIDRLGYRKNFAIYATGDQISVMRSIMRNIHYEDRTLKPADILATVSLAKNKGLGPEEIATLEIPDALLIAEFHRAYLEQMQALHAVDFDDLLLLCVELLRSHDDLREKYEALFRYLLIDEYQDTNHLQLELINLLGANHRNVCVVGDDDQSIYAWRGALPDNILKFEEHFRGARTITLNQNYRSTNSILKTANSVIRNNKARKEKELWSALGQGERVKLIAAKDEIEEAQAVVDDIRDRKFSDKMAYEDCAILVRTAIQTRPFEHALRAAQIPYRVIGGPSFFDRREIKDLLSYMRLVADPDDDLAFLRVVNVPARGIGAGAVKSLDEYARGEKMPLLRAAKRFYEGGMFKGNQAVGMGEFLGHVEWGQGQHAAGQRGSVIAEELIARLEWPSVLQSQEKDPLAAEFKLQQMQNLIAMMVRFEEDQPVGALARFIESVVLREQEGNAGDSTRDEVIIMTLHAAKGLEFPIVYLVGLEEGILPHKRSVLDNLDEERRLCYVGMTRAKKALVLTRAHSRRAYGKDKPCKPSRFLDEIDSDALDIIDAADHLNEEAKEEAVVDFFSQMRSRFGEEEK